MRSLQKRLLGVLTFCIVFATHTTQGSEDVFSKVLYDADAIELKFFNPTTSYRTIYGVGDINGPKVDFAVALACEYHCSSSLVLLPRLLSAARPVNRQCFGPPYARLELIKGESREVLATLLFDNLGTCITYNSSTFELPKSAILELYETPIGRW